MKKLLTTIVLIMVAVSASAQVEILSEQLVKGDPMLGTKDGIAWVGNNIIITENPQGDVRFTLTNKGTSHIFIQGAIMIGYYNSNDEFLCKTESYLSKYNIVQGSQQEWISVAFSKDSVPYSEYSDDKWVFKKMWRTKASDIMKWLRENDGYIRIVAPMYGGTSLDFKFALKKED